MHFFLLQSLFPFLLIASFLSINVELSLCQNQQFTNCSRNITCGSVGGISYPFWGVNRASYCGQPGFEVQCLNNFPVFNMKGASYRILQMNTTNSRTVKVARNDYWGTICPQTFVNTTLNFSLFDYVSGYRNMTFYYQCFAAITLPSPQSCNISNTVSPVYYVTQPVTVGQAYSVSCTHEVIVPVYEEAALAIEAATMPSQAIVTDAVEGGFSLQLEIDNDECDKCLGSGGQCGLDNTNNSGFRCFCADRAYASTCNGTSTSSQGGAMETHLYPFQKISLLLVITTTICLFHVQNSSAADDDRYLNCSASFQCANFRDVPYPFWGSSRPDYCGFPDFKLNCSGDAPVISFEGQDYRVLDINQSTSTLRVARTDFWNNLCPVSPANTTIKSSHIENTSDAQEVLLFYDCPPIFIPLPNQPTGQFNCSVNSRTTSINYFVTNLELPNISGYCNTTVTARVSQSAAADLGLNSSKDNLVAALDSGFGLKWDASNTLCGQCQVSGGQCGYNISSAEFTCFCKDGPNPARCEETKENA
ncbi:hypothetical protein ACFX1Q_047039 [Malus domestica]